MAYINTYKHDWFCWISLGLSSLSSHHCCESTMFDAKPCAIFGPRQLENLQASRGLGVHALTSPTFPGAFRKPAVNIFHVAKRFKNPAVNSQLYPHITTLSRSHHPNRSPSLESASAASAVASAVWGSATLGRNGIQRGYNEWAQWSLGWSITMPCCHVLLGKCWVNDDYHTQGRPLFKVMVDVQHQGLSSESDTTYI